MHARRKEAMRHKTAELVDQQAAEMLGLFRAARVAESKVGSLRRGDCDERDESWQLDSDRQ